jgi:hypothetical protein
MTRRRTPHHLRVETCVRARAYVMLEALVGGALLATVLLGLVGQIGEARAESTRQSRRITAQQLLMRELEELRALPFSVVSTNVAIDGIGAGDRVITVGNGRYRVQRVVSANQTETVQTSGSISVIYRTVTVTVSFPDRVGNEQVTGVTRIYSE